MSKLALVAVTFATLAVARSAAADCILTVNNSDPEIRNSVKVLTSMTGLAPEAIKALNGDESADSLLGLGCTGKVYVTGHTAEVIDLRDKLKQFPAVTEIYVYTCKCQGGVNGKVTFCQDEVIWPIEIAGVKGFLVKLPGDWVATQFSPGAEDMAAAGAKLLQRMRTARDCEATIKQQADSAEAAWSKADAAYQAARNQVPAPANLNDLKAAIGPTTNAKSAAKAAYDDCKQIKMPKVLQLITRIGSSGKATYPKLLTRVTADGVMPCPAPTPVNADGRPPASAGAAPQDTACPGTDPIR